MKKYKHKEASTDVILDYSITQSVRPGMQGGPVETVYGLFADFVNIVKK